MSGFPTTVDAVTPEWLSGALQPSGVLGSCRVTSFTAEPIGVGVGLMAVLHRLHLRYDFDANGQTGANEAPASVVIKLPVQHEQTRYVAKVFRFYEKEVGFYQRAAEQSALRTPWVYHSDWNADSDDFVLLMEDIRSGEVFSQLDGCPPAAAAQAVRALARHHAAFWDCSAFATDEYAWLPYASDAPMPEMMRQGFAAAWAPFLANFGADIPDDVRAFGARFPSLIDEMVAIPSGATPTMLHGDYRLDNMFFQDGDQVLALDWQIATRGVGGFDLGYFITQSLTVECRREHQAALLDLYRETLAEAGIDYPRERLYDDYRRSALLCLIYPVQAGGAVELVNERAVALISEMARRVVTAIHDLNCLELFPS